MYICRRNPTYAPLLMDHQNFLKQLDCSREESQTFDVLLSHPEGISVVVLAKKLNKPRATLYDHLNVLTEKGLVKKGLTEHGSVFYPEGHQTIRSIFDERAKSVTHAGILLEDRLRARPQSNAYNPRFTILDNQNAAEKIFRDVLRSRTKESLWFWPAKALFHKSVPDEVFNHWHHERIRRNMHVRVLWPHKQQVCLAGNDILGSGNNKESLRKIRILPGPIDATMGYGIYENKVGFISSTRENYGFIVDSKELAETLRNQFEFLWKISQTRK